MKTTDTKELFKQMLAHCKRHRGGKGDQSKFRFIPPPEPEPTYHVHIAINHGHVTWTGNKPPTKEQMEAFNKMAEMAFNQK